MNQLFFTTQNRRSLKTLRLHYGLEGMKYIIQMYEGEVNGHGEKEGLPTEYQFEFEQEMLKHVHNLKKDLREKDWRERDSPKVSQTLLLRSHSSVTAISSYIGVTDNSALDLARIYSF